MTAGHKFDVMLFEVLGNAISIYGFETLSRFSSEEERLDLEFANLL